MPTLSYTELYVLCQSFIPCLPYVCTYKHLLLLHLICIHLVVVLYMLCCRGKYDDYCNAHSLIIIMIIIINNTIVVVVRVGMWRHRGAHVVRCVHTTNTIHIYCKRISICSACTYNTHYCIYYLNEIHSVMT